MFDVGGDDDEEVVKYEDGEDENIDKTKLFEEEIKEQY